MAVGALYRPNAYLSFAGNYTFALANSDDEVVAELGIRPFGDEKLTIFADASKLNGQDLKDIEMSAGLVFEPLPGIRLNGRRFIKSQENVFSINFSTGFTNFTGLNISSANNESISSTYGIRIGGLDRTMVKDVLMSRYYAVLDLSQNIKYVTNRFFDNSMTLFDILNSLDKAAKNTSLKGLIINATQFSASRSMMWEIRNKIDEVKKSGKDIVIFIDRANIDLYHFASVANNIILDPMGMVMLEGYAMGRSYYKNLLEKADIGYEEFRYYKYKSAAESYSRENFSEGDREQRQKIVDDWYDITKSEIIKSRKQLSDNYENLVNNQMGYMAQEALDNKLVDQFDRWNNLRAFMEKYDRTVGLRNIFNIDRFPVPFDDKWGDEEKRISIIYAEGACDLNSGIRARMLADILRSNFENSKVAAIVLRVDSPGGDAMASDYISKIIAEFKDKKPLIVSQGQVAASGGYWLSMEADKIVAAPNTITGSIGVIGSWFYDKGLKDSLGISYDFVKKGKYADVGASYSLPLLPIGLPVRNLTEDEISQREKLIKALYKEFVNKVAKARNMTYDKVDEVAQGRVWTGIEAKKIGLVDEIGDLMTAVNIAKEKAGIAFDEDVKYLQYPTGQFFDFSMLLGGIFNVNIPKVNNEFNDLMFLMNNNGIPMPVLSIDYWK
jgi:protease-4